jgi:hypothetical protein
MSNQEEREEMRALQNKLNTQGDECMSELRAGRERMQKEIDEYALIVKAREVQRVRERDAAFEQSQNEKHTRIDESKPKCEAELASKPATQITSHRPQDKQFHADKPERDVKSCCSTQHHESK